MPAFALVAEEVCSVVVGEKERAATAVGGVPAAAGAKEQGVLFAGEWTSAQERVASEVSLWGAKVPAGFSERVRVQVRGWVHVLLADEKAEREHCWGAKVRA